MIPTPWVGLVLALATFRLARLAGWDDFPPVAKLRAKIVGERQHHDSTIDRDHPIIVYKRPTLNHFLGCPYCVGFWIGVVVYAAWLAQPRWTLYALAVFALNGAVGIIARMLDP